jgi:ribonuclease P protein component
MGITLISGTPPLALHDGVYVGTSASTKLNKSAVKRNIMRRRCREALRITALKAQKLPSYQLLIQPRSSSLSCDFDELRKDAEAFFQTL